MEFYKEVKTVALTAGQALDLSSASYNHKAFAVAEDAGLFTAYFYSKGKMDPTGLTFEDRITFFNLKTITPIRLAKIVPEGNGTLYLFN